MFKLQVQEDDTDARVWHDVRGPGGELLTFDNEGDARKKLEELYPVLVQLERFSAGSKQTRVLNVIRDEDDWPKK